MKVQNSTQTSINQWIPLLCGFTLFFFSIQTPVISQEDIQLTSSWVGVYELEDQPIVFFVDWDVGDNGRFQSGHASRSQPIDNLQQDSNYVQFSTGSLTFNGQWLNGAFVGFIEGEGKNGRFYLAPLAQITPDTFSTVIGSYDLESDDPILISRADKMTQLFYQQGNEQIRLYPTSQTQYLSTRGELITVQPEQIQIKNALAPESSTIQIGERTTAYQEEYIIFRNGEVSLSGTLFLPSGEGEFPAIILIHGAGAAEQHFYRIFADLFARNGVAALIYDKRGHGTSTGQSNTTTLQNLADDAQAGIRFLTQHEQIDGEQIGLWGFSQGGRILPVIAHQNEEAAFAIAVSAPGMSINNLNRWHLDTQQQEAGKSELERFFSLKMGQLQHGLSGQETSIDEAMQPTTYWNQVQQPILLIYGNKDRVIPPDDSAEVILTALKQAGNENVYITLFPNANHDIMLTETAVPTFASGYFEEMVSWIHEGFPTQTTRPTLQPTGEFSGNGHYAQTPWYGQIWFQLLLVLMIGGVIVITAVRIFGRYRHKQSFS